MTFNRTLGVLSCSVGLLALARSALACSYATPEPELRGVPSDGQKNVPTDVVPVYSAFHLNPGGASPGLFHLRTAGGDEVAITTEPVGNSHGALRPATALEPFTEYVLEAEAFSGESSVTLSLTFETGAGPLAGTPEPPPAFLQHFSLAPDVDWTSCDTSGGTCMALPEGDLYLLTYDGGVAPDPGYLLDGPSAMNFSGIMGIQCLDLRRRAINGTYSEPTHVCLKDAPSFVLHGDSSMTCTEAGIVHAGALVTDQEPADEPLPPDALPDGGAPTPTDDDEATDSEATDDVATDDATDDTDDTAAAPAQDTRANEAVGCNLGSPSSRHMPAALALALAAWTARRRRVSR